MTTKKMRKTHFKLHSGKSQTKMTKRMVHLKMHSGEKSNKGDKEDDTFKNAQWRKVNQR